MNSADRFEENWGLYRHAAPNFLNPHGSEFELREGSSLEARMILLNPSVELLF